VCARSLLLLFFVALVSALGCGAGRQARSPRRESPPPPSVAIVPARGAGEATLHLHRSYFALEHVGVAAHHFTVFYHHIEQCHCEASVVGNDVYLHGCGSGGLSVPPKRMPPVPSAMGPRAELVQSAIIDREPDATNLQTMYHGSYREIVVSEMIPISSGTPFEGHLAGWHGRVRLRADVGLTQVQGTAAGFSSSGFGLIDIPGGAARVELALAPADDGQHFVTDRLMHGDPRAAAGNEKALLDAALAVARKVAAGEAVAAIAPLLSAPVDASVPAAYDQPVQLRVTLYGRVVSGEQAHLELLVPLPPRAAIRDGTASATREGDVGGLHVRLTATLGRFGPSRQPSKQSANFKNVGEDMEAPLSLRLEDGRGNVYERSLPARGKVRATGEAVALPTGLELPGTSSPSKQADALRTTWPGHAAIRSFDVYVDPVLYASPRDGSR